MKRHNDDLIKSAYNRGYWAGMKKGKKDDQGGIPAFKGDDAVLLVYSISVAIGATSDDALRSRMGDLLRKAMKVRA